ncbi:tyrosine-type recombinase/integrase [Albimonas pacifica]|uniref:Phage integrase family protein n=1 Tax=Albimonas pacifica TaxID=1114924 RepID=A0A1I3FUS4_9RHOB|nr:site-specific integrase [Albimonas pacifica]SFI15008.1 Phage integrase family protein [Albimonas pacifica]
MGEVIATYLDGRGPEVADPERLAYAAQALLPFWAEKTVDTVKRATCLAYVRWRTTTGRTIKDAKGRERAFAPASEATARRELGTLQAALRWCVGDGKLVAAPTVTLPAKPPARDRWLTRDEAAALLRAASPHLRRFILIALYTGRRHDAILGLRWVEPIDRSAGHVDLRRGVIHFRGAAERQTKKRRGSVAMPRQLAAHMRRWQAMDHAGASHVVMWDGEPIKSVKRAWGEARARAGLGRDVTPHTLKHTAVTWAFQGGITREDAADYFDTTAATLEAVYRAHSPDHQGRAVSIMERRGR